MRRFAPTAVLVGTAVALVVGGTVPRPGPPARAEEPAPAEAKPAPANHILGVGSCATAGCHGGNGPAGKEGCEYTTWVSQDPHARAYQVLFNDRSRRMQANRPGAKGRDGKRMPATEDPVCLRCHASDPRLILNDPKAVQPDGVGCETCHGPAENWRAKHYRREVWDRLSGDEKAALGFRSLKSLTVRAGLCAECHVGTDKRDVNHDLIAAGHPRLQFEFAAYYAAYPRHWDDKAEREDSSFPARAWSVGQVAAARAALDLLASRAGNPEAPWPEFAEYGCFRCHHDLRDRGWHETSGRWPGSLAWGTWYYAALPPGLPGEASLEAVAELMNRPRPDRDQVAAKARRAADALGGWLKQGPPASDEQARTRLLAQLAGQGPALAANSDGAIQAYLALDALYRSLGDLGPKQPAARVRESLRDLRDELDRAFPREEKTGYDSPRGYDPSAVEKTLQTLQDRLRELGIR